MIIELYTFSPGSYVVADEWNANFRTIYKANMLHKESIDDMYNDLAFPDSDLSAVFASVKSRPNSSEISGNRIVVAPEQEYYKVLPSSQDLTIHIEPGLNAETRILIQTQEDRYTKPFLIEYTGTIVENKFVNTSFYAAGFYYIFIYETNGVAQVKLVWTGV